MIFITVGSREYPFDRLLKEIDKLIENGIIKESVFAQIGHSKYVPKMYKYKRFLDAEEYGEFQSKADVIISHGGTGALIGSLKKEKIVIAVPRLSKFGEHIDDHQIQVSTMLDELGYLKSVIDIDELGIVYNRLKTQPIIKKYKRESKILEIIEDFIQKDSN